MIQRNKYTNKYWYKGEWVKDIPDELKEIDFNEIDDYHIKETDENLKYKVIPSYF